MCSVPIYSWFESLCFLVCQLHNLAGTVGKSFVHVYPQRLGGWIGGRQFRLYGPSAERNPV